MKKIIAAVFALVSIASADVILGANLGYGNMEAEAEISGYSATADTKYTSLEFKAGYQWEQFRALGYFGTDNYKDDMIYQGEKNAKHFGLEGDFILPVQDNVEAFVGLAVGKGSKDFIIADVDFQDTALKGGVILGVGDGMQAEIGVQYKKREYDDTDGVSMDDELIGVYVGFNFML